MKLIDDNHLQITHEKVTILQNPCSPRYGPITIPARATKQQKQDIASSQMTWNLRVGLRPLSDHNPYNNSYSYYALVKIASNLYLLLACKVNGVLSGQLPMGMGEGTADPTFSPWLSPWGYHPVYNGLL